MHDENDISGELQRAFGAVSRASRDHLKQSLHGLLGDAELINPLLKEEINSFVDGLGRKERVIVEWAKCDLCKHLAHDAGMHNGRMAFLPCKSCVCGHEDICPCQLHVQPAVVDQPAVVAS